jgi:hypothetical protein
MIKVLPVQEETKPQEKVPVTEPKIVTEKSCEVFTVKDLPSKFKPYSDLDYIELRSFTLKELKYLASKDLSDSQTIETFGKAIRNVDVNNLSYPDYLFVGTHITVFTSNSHEWTAGIYCKKCGEETKVQLASQNLIKFEDLKVPALPIIIDIKGVECHFDVLRVKDIKPIEQFIRDVDKQLHGLASLAHIIRNMNPNEAFELLCSITDNEEIELLELIQEELFHGVLPLEITCSKCKHLDSYKVGFEVSTLKPFRADGYNLKNRINYGSVNSKSGK